jgi:hypothetical protein
MFWFMARGYTATGADGTSFFIPEFEVLGIFSVTTFGITL